MLAPKKIQVVMMVTHVKCSDCPYECDHDLPIKDLLDKTTFYAEGVCPACKSENIDLFEYEKPVEYTL